MLRSTPLFDLFSGNFFRNLNKTFILLDHAQIKAGTFLVGIVTLLQITHLGIKTGITNFKAFGDFLLLRQLTVVFPYSQPASFTQPERVLEEANDSNEANRQPAHSVLAQVVEGFATWIGGGIAEILFDAQQLVVLGDAVGT